jgi:beta-lactamase class A
VKRAVFLTSGAAAVAAAGFPVAARASAYEHLEAIARSVPGVVGFYCRTLADAPPLFEYNPHVQFPTASTIKALIMATAYVEEERRPGALHRRIETKWGTRTVQQLIWPMITVSDNDAANDLITHFGMPQINAVAHELGMYNTRLARHFLDFGAIVHHNDNVTTPSDMSRLLFAIARGAREDTTTICSSTHCRAMIRIMLHQTDRDKIPAGLPSGTAVANKTGEIDGSRSDIAIVQPMGDTPYILTVYSKWLAAYPPVYDAFRRVARLSYELASGSYA